MNRDQDVSPFASLPAPQRAPRAESFLLPMIDQCCRSMEFDVATLIEEAKAEATWTDSYDDAARLLESVPLDSDDFALARQRLHNALEYCLAGEFGAACFELRQLRTALAAL
jgi:hypothetical protein